MMTDKEALDYLKGKSESYMNWPNTYQAIQTAIPALEAKVPVKPDDIKTFGNDELIVGYCPCCGSLASDSMNFCATCGQRLGWMLK